MDPHVTGAMSSATCRPFVLISLGTISFWACAYSYFLFVYALLHSAALRVLHGWVRDVERHRPDLTAPLVYAPMLSGGAALTGGVGVNLFTDDMNSVGTFLISGLYVAGSLVLLAWGGKLLAERVQTGGPGLGRIRARLHLYTDPQFTPPDHAQALAWVRRIRRVGERLARQATTTSLRRWAVEGAMNVRTAAATWVVNLLTLALFTSSIVITIVTSGIKSVPVFVWTAGGIEGLAVLVVPAGLVLRRNTERWRLHEIGRELIDNARRAETALAQRTPPRTLWNRIRHWWQQRRPAR